MMELAMKQTTAPNRMGSHRALSSVMTFSPDSCRRFLLSDGRHSAGVCRVQQPLAPVLPVPPHCRRMQGFTIRTSLNPQDWQAYMTAVGVRVVHAKRRD